MNDRDLLSEQPMGETLLGKPYGLTHEDMIKAHHLLTATAKKTPYQLDLEVKDRKPDIVPKVGDKVKIKSREWYEKWRDHTGNITVGRSLCLFYRERNIWCGETLEVERIDPNGEYKLCGVYGCWISEYFEEVYPQELSTGCGFIKASDAIGTFISGLGKGSSVTSAIPAINAIQGIEISTDWGKIVLDDPAVITLPNSFSSRECTQVDIERIRSKWGLNKEPELQTIKKHRFIKLEKL